MVESGQYNWAKSIHTASEGDIENFVEADYVLIALDDFHVGKKLPLRWRGPLHIVKPLSDYIFRVEDLRNIQLEHAHGTHLKLYRDDQMHFESIMPQFLSSKTGMPVSRFMGLTDYPDVLKVLLVGSQYLTPRTHSNLSIFSTKMFRKRSCAF